MDNQAPSLALRLRRATTRRKGLAVAFAGFALTLVMATRASAVAGVQTVCLSDNQASNQNGGFRDVTVGPSTQSVQRGRGATRQHVLWQGTRQVCPSNAAAPCDFSYSQGHSETYSKVINLIGGIASGGGGPVPVPFPIFSVSGSVVNKSETTSWNITNTTHVRPGGSASPVLAVDYQEWSGNFVGAYHHAGETAGCHSYYLRPNEQFGNWHGEVATKSYATWQ